MAPGYSSDFLVIQARFPRSNISISVIFPKNEVMEPPHIMSPELCTGSTGAEVTP